VAINATFDRQKLRIQGVAGALLIRAATILEAAHQTNLLTRYPPSSKPGEYPHVRSGTLWRSVTHDPRTNTEAMKEGGVSVFYGPSAPYGDILTAQGRLSFADTMERVRSTIESRLALTDELMSRYAY
jgi:hypothetical protein